MCTLEKFKPWSTISCIMENFRLCKYTTYTHNIRRHITRISTWLVLSVISFIHWQWQTKNVYRLGSFMDWNFCAKKRNKDHILHEYFMTTDFLILLWGSRFTSEATTLFTLIPVNQHRIIFWSWLVWWTKIFRNFYSAQVVIMCSAM